MFIQYEEIFFEKLKTGINLFTGAGFSVLPNAEGERFPSSEELSRMICAEFDIHNRTGSKLDLEMISMKAKKKDRKKFDDFLRNSFRATSINKLYYAINRINISCYITTNIDNLIYVITEADDEKYVNTMINGVATGIGRPLNYIPLHGDITIPESKLYFGKLELSTASANNSRLFTVMQTQLMTYPTLFWGYGFHDSSVMTALGSIIEDYQSNIWIQFRNRELAEDYKELGFNIIIADTEELLSEIDRRFPYNHKEFESSLKIGEIWKGYKIPSSNDLNLYVEASDYYQKGIMGWNMIFSGYPYRTKMISEVYDRLLHEKKLIVIGSPHSGKTTLLRQIASYIGKNCYYIEELNLQQAKKLSKGLNGQHITIIVDDCTQDMSAFAVLMNEKSVQLLGSSDEYSFETTKHLLPEGNYSLYILPDIEENDAKQVYEHIPEAIRNKEFVYNRIWGEHYSFWEFSIENIRDVISKDKILQFLLSIRDTSIRELLFLTSYLCCNGSFLSTDTLWYYLKARNYDEVKSAVRKTNEALNEIGEGFGDDFDDQDYYSLRSNLFRQLLEDAALDNFKTEYKNTVKKIIEEVPAPAIYRYDIFKRSAFDAEFIYKLFNDTAESLYDNIYINDPSPYTYQQRALYLSRCQKFGKAFDYIDKASLELPNNYSIKNSKAIIIFEANKKSPDQKAKDQRYKAIEMLRECYQSDRRRARHAQKFAEFAVFINRNDGDGSYLRLADRWLKEIISDGNQSNWTKQLLRDVNEELQTL